MRNFSVAQNTDSTRKRVNRRGKFAYAEFFVAFGILLLTQSTNAFAQPSMREINPRIQKPMKIDLDLVADNGLRIIEGKHVTIYTDVPSRPEIDELPTIFDAAVPQWCDYFNVDVNRAELWKLQAFLIRDKQRFRNAELIPDELPMFPAGINQGHEFWFMVQPDDYYTRHLMLHEGTHGFMQWFGNGVGAPWYAEGMAELLGLHRWENGELTIGHRVSASTETEGWGRPKLIKDWVAANAEGEDDKTLSDVLLTSNRAFRDVENYAWSWAACDFLGQHPLSKDRFFELQKNVFLQKEEFNEEFQKLYDEDLDLLERDWALFIRELDYGFSVSRAAPKELQLGDEDNTFELKTDHSWQYLNRRVRAGQKYRISVEGRFKIGSSIVKGKEKPWPCEANGITIDWFRGRPIGELQAMVLPTGKNVALLPRLCQQKPISVGKSAVIEADSDGLLCFRINESPANLDDNLGSLKLAIEKVE